MQDLRGRTRGTVSAVTPFNSKLGGRCVVDQSERVQMMPFWHTRCPFRRFPNPVLQFCQAQAHALGRCPTRDIRSERP